MRAKMPPQTATSVLVWRSGLSCWIKPSIASGVGLSLRPAIGSTGMCVTETIPSFTGWPPDASSAGTAILSWGRTPPAPALGSSTRCEPGATTFANASPCVPLAGALWSRTARCAWSATRGFFGRGCLMSGRGVASMSGRNEGLTGITDDGETGVQGSKEVPALSSSPGTNGSCAAQFCAAA